MSSKALVVDSRFKSYMNWVGQLKWEQDMHFRRHKRSLKAAKAVIDNRSPDISHCRLLLKRHEELQEANLNQIEQQNFQLLRRLRAIRIKRKPEFCFRKRKALTRGDANKLKPPKGQIPFRYDWQSLRGAATNNSLRVQEEMLLKTINGKLAPPQELETLRKYLPKNSQAPLEKTKKANINAKVEEITKQIAALSLDSTKEERSPYAERHERKMLYYSSRKYCNKNCGRAILPGQPCVVLILLVFISNSAYRP